MQLSDTARKRLISFAVRLLHLWFSTCRIRVLGDEYRRQYLADSQKAVGATWHRGAIFFAWFFRKYRPMLMVSQSKDGDLLAEFSEKLGNIPVRGSSSRGGRAALKIMLAHMRQPGGQKVATVLDGPRGPRYVAKKGMIVLAMSARAPLIPLAVSASPAITFKKAWDKTMIPLPFSKVTVIYGKPWHIMEKLDSKALESLRQDVETRLIEMMKEADRSTGYDKIAKTYYR